MDLCYGSIKGAYSASSLPPLGASDHNVVHLRPVYQRLLEREKPQKRTVKIWNEDSIMALQGCFDCTSWEGFKCPDLNVQVEVISDYITFCVDSVLPTKTVKTYPNNKPWVSGKLKSLLNKKKLAHIHKDEIAKRDTQREIKRQIKIDKNTYKQKVEQNMALGNSRQAWQSIKAMTSAPHKGKGKNNIALKGGEGQDMANNLNVFFSRFEKWIGTNTDQKQPDLTSLSISHRQKCVRCSRELTHARAPAQTTSVAMC